MHPSRPWNLITHGFLDPSAFPDNSGVEMAASILWAPGVFLVLSAGKPHALKIPRFRGGCTRAKWVPFVLLAFFPCFIVFVASNLAIFPLNVVFWELGKAIFGPEKDKW